MSSSKIKNGVMKSSFPLIGTELLTNFKARLRIAGIPIYSMHRTPLTKEQAAKTFQTREADEEHRIFLNLGAVAYSDNRSGIPRVVKNLSREGLLADKVELIPVYADLETGVFHVAKEFARQLTGNALASYEDIMTVASGDTFLNVTVNPNELEFEHETFTLLRNIGVRVLCMVHDLIPELQPEFFRKRDSRLFRIWLHRIIQYDGIVAVSQTTLAAFDEWVKINDIKLPKGFQKYWFHLGADIQSNIVGSEICDDPEAKAITAEGASPYFLQVGTVEPRKGHDDLLDGFERLWAENYDLNLVIVGRRGWNVHQLSRKILNHPQFGKKLFWLRNADDVTLHYLYRHAEAVVLASKAEGYGLPVAEGAWFKRPLLLRDIPIFREIAQDGASYFSNGGKGLADAVRLLHDKIQHHEPVPMPKPDQFLNWKQSFAMLQKVLASEVKDSAWITTPQVEITPKMKCYFINLDRSWERRRFIEKQFNHLQTLVPGGSIELIRVSAVDANELDEESVALHYKKDYRSFNARFFPNVLSGAGLSAGEIACFLSHRKCWQQIVQFEDDYAVVLEDDVIFSDKAGAFFSGTAWIPADADVVKLEVLTRKIITGIEPKNIWQGKEILRLYSSSLGTAAYVISKKAAQRFLEMSDKFSIPVDHFMFSTLFPYFSKFVCYQVVPAVCIQDSEYRGNNSVYKSTMHLKKEKFSRRIRRMMGIGVKTKRELIRIFLQIKSRLGMRKKVQNTFKTEEAFIFRKKSKGQVS